jgi:hypothetical protein
MKTVTLLCFSLALPHGFFPLRRNRIGFNDANLSAILASLVNMFDMYALPAVFLRRIRISTSH